MNLQTKHEKLIDILTGYGSVMVAFSGGVDSTFLLNVAHETLGENAVALTATSETYPEHELNEAIEFTKSNGIKQIIIDSNELEIDGFANNDVKRCYYCKLELFNLCRTHADKHNIMYVLDGTNFDDLSDYRPGRDAANELDVKSPLLEAELTKDDIRALSKDMGLKTFDKPAFACLSSRFPYGTKITKERLNQIRACEMFLRENSIKQFRVRYHGDLARIEVLKDDIARFSDTNFREQVVNTFKENGFTYISLDLEGYRTGSQNEVIGK